MKISNGMKKTIKFLVLGLMFVGFVLTPVFSVKAVTTITTKPASNIFTTLISSSANLNAVVNPDNLSTIVSFEYGKTTSYGNSVVATQSPVTGNTSVTVSAHILNLDSGSVYHFRAKGVNSLGTVYGSDVTFLTSFHIPLKVTTQAATNINKNSASLNATLLSSEINTLQDSDYELRFYWDTGVPSVNSQHIVVTDSDMTGTLNKTISKTLGNLLPDTKYFYNIQAHKKNSTLLTPPVSVGEDKFFKTSVANYNLTISLQGEHPMGSFVKVTSNGTDIPDGNCLAETENGAICNITVLAIYSPVTLTQSEANDAMFVKWGGDCTGSDNTCVLDIDSDEIVSAEFSKVNVIPGGGNTNNTGNQNTNPNPSGNANVNVSLNSENGGLVPCGIERSPLVDANGKAIPDGGKILRPCNFDYFMVLINNVIRFILFYLAVPISAIMFAYAGFLLLFSGGEASAKTHAKKIFTGVAMGLILAMAAWLIIHTILIILGVNTAFNWFGLAKGL